MNVYSAQPQEVETETSFPNYFELNSNQSRSVETPLSAEELNQISHPWTRLKLLAPISCFFVAIIACAFVYFFVFLCRIQSLQWILPRVAANSDGTYWILFLCWEQLCLMVTWGGFLCFRKILKKKTLWSFAGVGCCLGLITMFSGSYWPLFVPVCCLWNAILIYYIWQLKNLQPDCSLLTGLIVCGCVALYTFWSWTRISFVKVDENISYPTWPFPDKSLAAFTYFLNRGYLSGLPIYNGLDYVTLGVESLLMLWMVAGFLLSGYLSAHLFHHSIPRFQFSKFIWAWASFALLTAFLGSNGLLFATFVVCAMINYELWITKKSSWRAFIGRMIVGIILGFALSAFVFSDSFQSGFSGILIGLFVAMIWDCVVVFQSMLRLLIRRLSFLRGAVPHRLHRWINPISKNLTSTNFGWFTLTKKKRIKNNREEKEEIQKTPETPTGVSDESTQEEQPFWRAWTQIRLSTVLLITLLIAEFLGGVLAIRRLSNQHLQATEELQKQKATITTATSNLDILPGEIGTMFQRAYARGTSVHFSNVYQRVNLSPITDLVELKILVLKKVPVKDEDLIPLQQTPHLQQLSLSGTKIMDEGFLNLPPLSKMQKLDISETSLSDSSMQTLQQMKDLRVFYANQTMIKGNGLADLQDCVKLEKMDLSSAKLDSKEFSHLPYLPKVELLLVGETDLDDNALIYLKRLPNLKYLDLSNTQITSKGIKHLNALKELRVLALNFTKVDNSGLMALKQLPRLEKIELRGTAISDEGLFSLQALPHLDQVALDYANITNLGLEEYLFRCPHLQAISLSHTQVTEDALQRYRSLRPEVNVEMETEGTPEDIAFGNLSSAGMLLKEYLSAGSYLRWRVRVRGMRP